MLTTVEAIRLDATTLVSDRFVAGDLRAGPERHRSVLGVNAACVEGSFVVVHCRVVGERRECCVAPAGRCRHPFRRCWASASVSVLTLLVDSRVDERDVARRCCRSHRRCYETCSSQSIESVTIRVPALKMPPPLPPLAVAVLFVTSELLRVTVLIRPFSKIDSGAAAGARRCCPLRGELSQVECDLAYARLRRGSTRISAASGGLYGRDGR